MKDMRLMLTQLVVNQKGASAPTPPPSPPPPTRTADHSSWPLLTANGQPEDTQAMTGVQLFPPGTGTSLALVTESPKHQNKRRKVGRSPQKSKPSQAQYINPGPRNSDSDPSHSDGWLKC